MPQLCGEKFPKIMAYLNNPVGQRVRTNNRVERTNRMVRSWEKVRYKWRRRKTLVRFVVLRLDDIWSHWVAIEARETKSPKIRQRRKAKPLPGKNLVESRENVVVFSESGSGSRSSP